MNLVSLSDDLKIYILQYLPISDYASLSLTCKTLSKFCSDSSQVIFYWKKVYQDFYSSKNLSEENISHENPWKNRIKLFEYKLKEQKIFSNKFRVCVELKCEKMGSLKKEIMLIKPDILTICLRDLLKKKCELDNHLMLELAKELLHFGANPLKETNIYLEDSPLRIAILNNNSDMINLFIKHINQNNGEKFDINQVISTIKRT